MKAYSSSTVSLVLKNQVCSLTGPTSHNVLPTFDPNDIIICNAGKGSIKHYSVRYEAGKLFNHLHVPRQTPIPLVYLHFNHTNAFLSSTTAVQSIWVVKFDTCRSGKRAPDL